MALELGARLVPSLDPDPLGLPVPPPASLWFVRPLVGHSARWVITA